MAHFAQSFCNTLHKFILLKLTNLYHRSVMGAVPACHSECASNTQAIGAKSSSSSIRQPNTNSKLRQAFHTYVCLVYTVALQMSHPNAFSTPAYKDSKE